MSKSNSSSLSFSLFLDPFNMSSTCKDVESNESFRSERRGRNVLCVPGPWYLVRTNYATQATPSHRTILGRNNHLSLIGITFYRFFFRDHITYFKLYVVFRLDGAKRGGLPGPAAEGVQEIHHTFECVYEAV